MTNHKEIQWARFKGVIRGNTHDEILFNKSDETNDTRYAVQGRDRSILSLEVFLTMSIVYLALRYLLVYLMNVGI